MDDEGGHKLPRGVGGKWIESWLEPAWRSDRMGWMLSITAMGLSYELGAFYNINFELMPPHSPLLRQSTQQLALIIIP
jgi:hypothetical protein